MPLRALTPAFGAVVDGVDAGAEIDDVAVASILEALLTYKVLFFPEQHLTVPQQERFAARFGPPFADPLTRTVAGHPGMATVTRVDHFHSDHMHMADPPKFSMLQLNVVPETGGDTMWADLVASYEALSPPVRQLIDGLTGVYVSRDPSVDVAAHYGGFLQKPLTEDDLAEIRQALEPPEHPLVRLIPETGRKNYWLCRRFTRAITGLSQEESDAVLGLLFAHQLRPEFVLRWKWHAGDLAFWDHRTTLHAGVGDYGSHERHGQCASIAGGRPLPVSSSA
ncbi:MAG: TauD/TfdA dioxygenase family protein [Actinomycetes bacterium]